VNDYEDTIAHMNDWTRDAASWDREARQQAADAAQRDNEFITARRRDIETEIAAEVADMAERRGHAGRPTTHDLALARSAVAVRFGHSEAIRAEVADILAVDPEPLRDDYRRAAPRSAPPADDRAFGDRLAAAAAGLEALAELRARGARVGRFAPLGNVRRAPALPIAAARSLRASRDRIDALLGSDSWS
jgi:hypothetical protein